MIKFKAFINEKRRNPDVNITPKSYDVLKKYKDRDDIFLSFTKVNKIGINPIAFFNTPTGIYTYPLKHIWKDFDHINKRVIVPLAGNRPNIYVLKSVGKIIDTSTYSNSDLKSDLSKLDLTGVTIEGSAPIEKLMSATLWLAYGEDPKTPYKELKFPKYKKIIKDGKKTNVNLMAQRWAKIFRDLGYNGINDTKGNVIDPRQAQQAVFFKKQAFKVIEVVVNTDTKHNYVSQQLG